MLQLCVMETVVALFNEPAQARTALRDLLDRGFEREHLAFSVLDVVEQDSMARETGISPEDGAPGGSGTVMRGAFLGMLAGIALTVPIWLVMLILPETRSLHVGGLYGVLFGALGGLGLGLSFGALASGDHGDYVKLLRRMGVPERIALTYWDGMKDGKVMVIARDQAIEKADEALAIMADHGAVNIEERTGRGRLQSERVAKGERPHR